MDQNDVLDLHITHVATWATQLLGRAILVATGLPAAAAVTLTAVGQPGAAVAVAAVGFPVVFGWQLMGARAPLPIEVGTTDDVSR